MMYNKNNLTFDFIWLFFLDGPVYMFKENGGVMKMSNRCVTSACYEYHRVKATKITGGGFERKGVGPSWGPKTHSSSTATKL
jgi:hypothetical protein